MIPILHPADSTSWATFGLGALSDAISCEVLVFCGDVGIGCSQTAQNCRHFLGTCQNNVTALGVIDIHPLHKGSDRCSRPGNVSAKQKGLQA